ncbi:5861_t:CDS:2 [Funneliformis geosporum]|uniref:10084_t:CDS:1 n=1 Tax=Funneliformis geosporum TaxID=1117311 RepID=A0A9W4SKH6_9GLOM|nr:5861_t:CDS:2 [Funneliformis geosporum]CAI2172808.1 10084_t:CDS:2 [Funneliformis geosporum]
MQISAVDKTTGRSKNVTITNDKVTEAKRYREDDERDQKCAIKLFEDEIQESITWLENNKCAEQEVYDSKLRSLEQSASQLMTRLNVGGSVRGGLC